MPRAGWLAFGGLLAAIYWATLAGENGSDSIDRLGPALAAVLSGALLLAGALVARRRRTLLVAFGLMTVGLRLAAGSALAIQEPPPRPLPSSDGAFVATLLRLGSTDGATQRALLAVVPENAGGPIAPWSVYAWLPRYPVVAAGDRIAFNGRLEPAPDGPGFGEVLRNQGAVASVRPRSFSLVPADRGLLGQVEPIRRAAGERLFAVLPRREAGLAAGILVGLRDLVDRSVAASFTTAGLSHVVAISGWNIAQVAAVILSLLRWLPRRPRSLIVIAAIALYTLLAGGSASVVRAAVMGAVALLARESGRKGGAGTALGLAIWALLLADPQMATDIGFQLSSAATVGLLSWATPLQERLAARAWRRLPGWLLEAIAVSTAAQAATLSLVLFHFGRLSLVSPLANLVAAPLIAPVMLLSLVGLLVGVVAALGVPVFLLAPAVVAVWTGLAALIAIADLSAAVPFASLSLPPPVDLVAALVTAAAVFVAGTPIGGVWARRIRQRLPAVQRIWSALPVRRVAATPLGGVSPAASTPPASAPAASAPAASAPAARTPAALAPGRRTIKIVMALSMALALGSAAVLVARPDGRLRVTVLDVGQGDAILIEGDRGARMLIDGGPDPDVLLRRLDERIPSWDRQLDLLVLTHPHEDHAGGMPLLLQRYRVGTVAETGMLGNGPADHQLRRDLMSLGVVTLKLAGGDHVQLDGASASVLWPRAGTVPLHPQNSGSAVNDVSIVVDIRFGSRRFLLMGDVEQEIDPELLWAGIGAKRGQPRADLLKVAHHGSRTASTDPFLQAVQPRVAFVSAGTGNPYGHPAAGTLQRLRDSGAQVLRTDLDGTLTASTDGTDFQASSSGPHGTAPTRKPRLTSGVAGYFCAVPLPPVALSTSGGSGQRSGPSTSLSRVGSAALRARPGDMRVRQELVLLGRPGRPSPGPQPPCYDRPRDRPDTRAGRQGAARPASGAPPAPPCGRHRRDRGVPRRARRPARNGPGSAPGRVRRAPS